MLANNRARIQIKICLMLLFFIPGTVFAADIALDSSFDSWTWVSAINSTNLTAGTGSDLTSTYDSAEDQLKITITNTSGNPWTVTARISTNDLPTDASLWVARTSNGTGGDSSYIDSSPVDIDQFVEVPTSGSVTFITGSRDQTSIPVRIRLSGITLNKTSPGNYAPKISFDISQP
jgi:hypothetical protein